MTVTAVPHGTISGYNRHGCRCVACRKAKAEYRQGTLEARTGVRGEQKRRWDRENMLSCACGNLIWRHNERCWECETRRRYESRAVRESDIQALWLAGLSLREIAARLGTTEGTISATMGRMRKAGVDLPYRRHRRA